MILQTLFSLTFIISSQAKATPYANCEKSYGQVLDSCGSKGSTIASDSCSKNIEDCKKKCAIVNDTVARLHVMDCNSYRKASSEDQKAVTKSMEKVSKELNDKMGTEKANKGNGIGILNGLNGDLTLGDKFGEIKKIQGGISMPINVPPSPAITPPASQ